MATRLSDQIDEALQAALLTADGDELRALSAIVQEYRRVYHRSWRMLPSFTRRLLETMSEAAEEAKELSC